MFTRKSKAERAAQSARAQADQVKGAAADRLARANKLLHDQSDEAQARFDDVRERGAHAAHDARERLSAVAATAAANAAVARDRAVAGLDHGIDAAAPKVSDAVGAVGPKVDHARDVIVDEYLPRIQAALSSLVDRKDEVLAKPDGAVAVVTGAPKKKGRKGLVLLTIGVVAAAGAGVAAYLAQAQKAERKADPWAEPTGASADKTDTLQTPGETTTGVAPVTGQFPVRTEAEPPAPAEGNAPAEANDDVAPGTPSADASETEPKKD